MESDELRIAVPMDESAKWVATAHKARLSQYMLEGMLDPKPSSQLAADDLLYRWEKCSAWSRAYLLAACDHLLLWANVVAPQDFPDGLIVENHPRPYYALARAGLESACQAVWILDQPESSERGTRHLRLVFHDLRNMALSFEAVDDARSEVARDRMRLLEERIEGTIDFDSIRRGEPKYLEMLRECSGVIARTPGELEATWREASGAAHGKNWFQQVSSTVIVEDEFEPEYFRARHLPDPTGVTKVMEAATGMVFYGTLRFAERAGFDFKAHCERAFSRLKSETPFKEET